MSQSVPLKLKENRKKSQRINLGYDWAIKGRKKTQNKKTHKACSESHLLHCITSNPNTEIPNNFIVQSTDTLVSQKSINNMKIRASNQEKTNEDFYPDNTCLIQTGTATQAVFRHFYVSRKEF